MGQEEAIYLLRGRICSILLCSTYFHDYPLFKNHTRHTRPVEAEEEEHKRIRMRNMQQNKTVMKMFVWIVSAFFICWTPLCVQIVLQKLFTSSRFTKDSCMIFVSLFFYIFPSLNTIVNPIILFAYSSRFSSALRNLFACFTCGPCLCCKDRRIVPNSNL